MEDYYLQKGFERLKFLNPDFFYKEWYFNKVINSTEIVNKKFYTDCYEFFEEEINVNQITGSYHCRYYGKTWIEMLGSLKRFENNIKDCESALSYINTEKQSINLNRYGDDYIIGEGNHRSCLAKFLNIEKIKASVTKYEFNEDYYSKWKELKSRNITPLSIDENNWTLKLHDDELIIKDRLITHFIEHYDSIKYRQPILNIFRSNSQLIIIKSNKDFKMKKLHNSILKNKTYNNKLS